LGFLDLNLYEHPSGVAFDPEKVIGKAKASFPEATFLPEDQLAAEARRAEVFFAAELQADPHGPASKVVRSLQRKARSYGPAYAFFIPQKEGKPIRGLARSVNAQFLFEEPLPEETRDRLLEFLRSLGVGRLEASTNDARQSEVLDDLRGESAYLSDKPGVPWDSTAYPVNPPQPEMA
jgi:hypothetical protein